MDTLTNKEILKASDAIDEAFAEMTPQNRGKISLQIVKLACDLNDHIADKLWSDINPQQPMSVNKVASKMQGRYRFIAHFDKFLQKSLIPSSS